eukprot:Gregarina_sp_Poly_1__10056@NODE_677_length_6821_cov_54_126740_g510_i0_p1_GENE_NODE_677_length_6821_cov_54_126740_g510_i0NODE_677_length_6821_cov_54_126740_g510_i0_p1_ORF_typecomplete_len2043_score351_26VIR_N/PF15912_5/2e03VIR_N/PF15912_5/0_0005SWIM/PF04434_17/3_6SWIM/PF04434_17/94_NODE_677_length_6821_cov_54_126740_g510_i06926412
MPVMNNTVVGQTNPLPAQCKLEAWASNLLPALTFPEGIPSGFIDSGVMHKLGRSNGSLPNSLVFVPEYENLGREVRIGSNPAGEAVTAFPQLILTDTIVVRGIYNKLTLCLFGAHLDSIGMLASRAADNLWDAYVTPPGPELHLAMTHLPETSEGCVDDNELESRITEGDTETAVIATAFKEAIEEKVENVIAGTTSEEAMIDTAAKSDCTCDNYEFEQIMCRLVDGWQAIRADGGAEFAVAYDRLCQLEINWSCSCKDKWLSEVAALVFWANYPASLYLGDNRLVSASGGTGDTSAPTVTTTVKVLTNNNEADKNAAIGATRVVTMFDSDPASAEFNKPQPKVTNLKSLSLSPDKHQLLERYWIASSPLKVCAIEVAVAFCKTEARARKLGLNFDLVNLMMTAISKNVANLRQHKVAATRLLIQLLSHDASLVDSIPHLQQAVESLASDMLKGSLGESNEKANDVTNVMSNVGSNSSSANSDTSAMDLILAPSQTYLHNAASDIGICCLLQTIRLYKECSALVAFLKKMQSEGTVESEVLSVKLVKMHELLARLVGEEAYSASLSEMIDGEETDKIMTRSVVHESFADPTPQSQHSQPALLSKVMLCPNLQTSVKNVLRSTKLVDSLVTLSLMEPETESDSSQWQAWVQKPVKDLLFYICCDCLYGLELLDDSQILELSLAMDNHRLTKVFQLMLPLKREKTNWDYVPIINTVEVGSRALIMACERFSQFTSSIINAFKSDDPSHFVYAVELIFNLCLFDLDRFEMQLSQNKELTLLLKLSSQRVSDLLGEKFAVAFRSLTEFVSAKNCIEKLTNEYLPQLVSLIPGPLLTTPIQPAIGYLCGDSDSYVEADRRRQECTLMAGFKEGFAVALMDTTKPYRYVELSSIGSERLHVTPDANAAETRAYVTIVNQLLKFHKRVLERVQMASAALPLMNKLTEAFLPEDYSTIFDTSFLDLMMKLVKKNLSLVARDLFPDNYDFCPKNAQLELAAVPPVPKRALTELLANSLDFLRRVLFSPSIHDHGEGLAIPGSESLFGSSSIRLLDGTLLTSLFLLLSRCLKQEMLKGDVELARFGDELVEIVGLWFDLSDDLGQRWIFKQTLKQCVGLPILVYTRLRILNRIGEKSFAILHNSRSGLSFAITKSTHPPLMLPLQLSSCDINALEATLEVSIHSMTVTLSMPSKIASDPEKAHIRGEESVYVCCSVPSANFAATDDRHIALLAHRDDVFSKSVFPMERPDGTRRGSFDMADLKAETPTWDLVLDKLVRKVKDNVSPLEWAVLNEATIDFSTLAEFLDTSILILSVSNSPSLMKCQFRVLPAVVASGLPLLPLLSQRLKYLSSNLLSNTQNLDQSLCQLTKLSLTISLLPGILSDLFSKQDALWTGSSVLSLSQSLKQLVELPQGSTPSVLPRWIVASIKMFLSLLNSIRCNRQSSLAFTVLTHTRSVLSNLLRLTNLALSNRQTSASILESLVSQTLVLVDVCLSCSFIRVLMAADMPHHSLDTASQIVFVDEPSRIPALTGSLNPIGRLGPLMNYVNEFESPPAKAIRAAQILRILQGAFDCHLPKEFLMKFFFSPASGEDLAANADSELQSAKMKIDVGDLLAAPASPSRTLPIHSLMAALASPELETQWNTLHTAVTNLRPDAPSVILKTGVAPAAFHEKPNLVLPPKEILQSDLDELIEHELCFDESVFIDCPSVLHPGPLPPDSLLTHCHIRKRVPQVVTPLPEEEGPFRIEMENYEDPESPLPAGSDPSRQKRSLSAKAARYQDLHPHDEGMPGASVAATPSYASSVVSPNGDGMDPRPLAAMDDWSTFTSQASIFQPRLAPAETPPVQPAAETPALDSAVLADEEFQRLREAGERMGLNIINIFQNPALLNDDQVHRRFVSLMAGFPNFASVIQDNLHF